MTIRLIDANKLEHEIRKSMNERYKSWTKTIKVADISTLIFDAIASAPSIMTARTTTEGFPIIDMRPRNTGEWLDIYSSHIAYKCSCCGVQMPITDLFNYCPNCGAYMQKEAEHDSN